MLCRRWAADGSSDKNICSELSHWVHLSSERPAFTETMENDLILPQIQKHQIWILPPLKIVHNKCTFSLNVSEHSEQLNQVKIYVLRTKKKAFKTFNSNIPTEIHLNFSFCDFCKIISRWTTILFGPITDKWLRIITFWGRISILASASAAQDTHRPPACVRNHSCEAAQPVKSSYQQTFLIFSFCQFDFPCTVFMSRRRTNCPLGTN